MKYVFEQDISIPLCAVKDNFYLNYLNGVVIDDPSIISFIQNGIKNKTLKIKQARFNVYKIIDTRDDKLIAYNYELNGISSYIDFKNKCSIINKFIIDKLILGIYKQELLWGEINE